MLTDEKIAAAVRGHHQVITDPRVEGWFAVNSFAARWPAPTEVEMPEDDTSPGLVPPQFVREHPKLVEYVERYRNRVNWVQLVHEVAELRVPPDPDSTWASETSGERSYESKSVVPGRTGTRTTIQGRFGELLDGLEVWRGVANSEVDAKDPRQWPLVGVDASGEVVVFVMPLRRPSRRG